jgi:hypothetical protein
MRTVCIDEKFTRSSNVYIYSQTLLLLGLMDFEHCPGDVSTIPIDIPVVVSPSADVHDLH